jgi:hypothetical protein
LSYKPGGSPGFYFGAAFARQFARAGGTVILRLKQVRGVPFGHRVTYRIMRFAFVKRRGID